jgi:two-component sensor histidine kinase
MMLHRSAGPAANDAVIGRYEGERAPQARADFFARARALLGVQRRPAAQTGRGILEHLIVVSVLVFLPSLLFVSYLLVKNAAADKDKLNLSAAAKAREVAGLIDRKFEGLKGAAQTLALSRDLRRGDLAAFYEVASNVHRFYGSHVIVSLPNGKQLIDTRAPLGDALPMTPPNMLKTDLAVLQSGEPAVSSIHKGALTTRPEAHVVVPAVCNGQSCLIKIAMDVRRIQDIALEALAGRKWIIAVTDDNGCFAAQTKDYENSVATLAPQALRDAVLGKPFGTATIVNKEGVWVDNNFHRIASADWTATVSIPQATLDAPFWANMRNLIYLTVIWFVFTSLAAMVVGRRVRSALVHLAKVAPNVAEGLPVERLHTPVREVNEVSVALAEASDQIRRHQETLGKHAEHTRFLMREVLHRAKNQLTIIQSILRQTLGRASNAEEFQESFVERLQGLAETQNVFVKEAWEGAPIDQLLYSHVKHFLPEVGDRILLCGPDLKLRPEPAQNLGMVFHELASNAAKYGALKTLAGRIEILWRIEGDRFVMTWKESGGPPVVEPTRKGFGTQVITRVAASALEGDVEVNYDNDGFRWSLSGSTAYFVQKS